MTFRFSSAHLLACFLALFFARTPALAQTTSPEVTGTVTYRERMALPADAVIDVQLLDTSVADVAAQTVAELLINAEGRQVPVPFTLTYDPAKIVPGNRYSMRATIRSGDGMLMFSSTQAYPVLTHGAPSKVNLILHTVGHGAKPGATAKKAPAPSAPEAAPGGSPTTLGEASSSSGSSPSSVTPATAQESDKTSAQAEAPALSNDLKGDTLGITEQRVSVEPAPVPATSSTIPQHATTTPTESTPSETAPGTESSSRAPGSTPPAQENGPPATTEQQPQPAETPATSPTPAPDAPAVQPGSRPAEASSAAPAQTNRSESKAEPTTPMPEANATAPESPLPEAPSASKHAEVAAAAPDSAGEEAADSVPARPAPNKALTPLADTQWKLIQLAGQNVVITLPQKPVTLAFSPEGKRIAGSAGCNSYIGTFTDTNGRLHLSPGNMTMMVCADPAGSRERKFVAMLRSVDGYKISGDFLLLTTSGKTVAKFRNNQE